MVPEARIILDSTSPHGARLITAQFRIPAQWIHELSMYVFVDEQDDCAPLLSKIEEVETDPYMPESFVELPADDIVVAANKSAARLVWNQSVTRAVENARLMAQLSPKQRDAGIALLHPFRWTTVVATATEWDQLIDSGRFGALVSSLKAAISSSQTQRRGYEPHMPFLDDKSDLIDAWHQNLLCPDVSLQQALYLVSVGRLVVNMPNLPAKIAHDVSLEILRTGDCSFFRHVARPLWVGDAEAILGRGTGRPPLDPWPADVFSGSLRGWFHMLQTIPGCPLSQPSVRS